MEKRLTMILASLFLCVGMALAQTTVTGTVVSQEDGLPIIGATVRVDGTDTGTVTDADGRFSLSLPSGKKKLVVSYVGMETQEVTVRGRNVNVTLLPVLTDLDEVMVVAYGTSTKSAFTGSAAVVKSEEIAKIASSNALSALSGKVSGVQINSATGAPGEESFTIRIRGISSISADSKPLIVVDGVPYDGELNNINQNDIASMTVLKDAASAALYGARGANGVVIITTKSAEQGRTSITVDAKWGANTRGVEFYNTVESPAAYYETYYNALKNYSMVAGNDAATAHNWAVNNMFSGAYNLGYNVYTVPEGQSLIGTDGKLNPNATLGRVVNGYLLKRPNGDVWQWDLWQAGMGLVDFTNPAAWKWYQDKLRVLLDQGVDCFKTDFGERIPTDVVYYDGSDPELMHNYYTYLYNKCVFELLEEYKGKDQACLFARSATVGGQKFPVHWGGDCSSNYLSMSESLRGGLSLCLSGFGFWSHDISGFEGTAPDDVYKRWAAFGLLSTHSRLHGSNSYRVPWLFGEEAVDVVRKFTNLKCTLMPYLFSAAVETHNTGVPTMRAMVLEFPNDIPCADLDRQYMLGGDLLVAPVFTKEGDVDYYLPEGTWTNFLDNRVVEGGKWQHEVHDFMSLPLMARENSLIAIGADDQNVEYDFGKDLTLHLFALKDKASADVKDMYGNDMLKAWAQNQDGKVTLKFQGRAENLQVLLRNVQSVKDLSGATAEEHELGTLLHVNAGLEEVTFQF